MQHVTGDTAALDAAERFALRQLCSTAYLSIGKLDDAEKAAQKLLDKNPGSLDYTRLLLSIYVQSHRPEKAMALADKLLAQNPSDSTALYTRALLHMRTKAQTSKRQREIDSSGLQEKAMQVLPPLDTPSEREAVSQLCEFCTPAQLAKWIPLLLPILESNSISDERTRDSRCSGTILISDQVRRIRFTAV
jgi:tetratricopeptide (TPR) repeat protein